MGRPGRRNGSPLPNRKLVVDHISGLTGLGPGKDAVEVSANHAGHLLHRRDLGTQNIDAPLLEHGGDDVNLLAVEDGT
jgi:hypothetical protein